MKRFQQHKLTGTFKSGFIGGAILALTVYIFARVLFYEFTFTAWEEISNFFIIVTCGGLMVGTALVVFLLLEMCLQYLSGVKVASFPLTNKEPAEYPMADINTAA